MNIINLIKQKLIKTPWDKFYTKEDLKVKVPDTSMYEVLKEAVLKYESRPIINYFGKRITYREFLNNVDKAALAFRSQGVRRGDIVTICMPNTPEAMISFYALNKIGAICNMIHPLSGEVEIKEYLLSTNSVMLVMIDLCYEKVKNIRKMFHEDLVYSIPEKYQFTYLYICRTLAPLLETKPNKAYSLYLADRKQSIKDYKKKKE